MKTFATRLLGFVRSFREARLRRAIVRYRSRPGPAETIRLANALFAAGRGKDAVAAITDGRRKFPAAVRVEECCDRLRRRQAKAMLRAAIRTLRADRTPENYVTVADLCRSVGDFKRGFAWMREAETMFPGHWAVQFGVGKLYFYRFNAARRTADCRACLGYLRRARELNGRHYNTAIFLAITMIRLGLYRDAWSVLEETLSQVPNDPKALELRAYLSRIPGKSDSAGTLDREGVAVEADGPEGAISQRVRSAIPGTVALFVFDGEGSVLESWTRPTDLFALGDDAETVRAMAAGCRFDADRIGIGALRSCVVNGESWQIVIETAGSVDVVGFFEASPEGEDLRSKVQEICAGPVAA